MKFKKAVSGAVGSSPARRSFEAAPRPAAMSVEHTESMQTREAALMATLRDNLESYLTCDFGSRLDYAVHQ